MPTDQQAKLRELVRELVESKGWSVKQSAEHAGLSPSTLYNWLSGGDELGELAIRKLSKVLGSEIEQLFYNTGHDPAKADLKAGTPNEEEDRAREDRARKDRAIREIERLIDALHDPAERARAWDVVLGTVRAYTDAHTSGDTSPPSIEITRDSVGRGSRSSPASRNKSRAGKDLRG